MQTDPCRICGEPAAEYVRVQRTDGGAIEPVTLVPICEPHRLWIATAPARGRSFDGVNWRLAEA
jgi:hypothetical protein